MSACECECVRERARVGGKPDCAMHLSESVCVCVEREIEDRESGCQDCTRRLAVCVCVCVRKREEVGGWPDWNRAVCESV